MYRNGIVAAFVIIYIHYVTINNIVSLSIMCLHTKYYIYNKQAMDILVHSF